MGILRGTRHILEMVRFSHTVFALPFALLSAVLAPLVFKVCRLIDARFARTEREREAAREGYLT